MSGMAKGLEVISKNLGKLDTEVEILHLMRYNAVSRYFWLLIHVRRSH